MPKFSRVALFLLLATVFPLALASDDRADHFEGEPSRTLEEALENFSQANAELAEIFDQGELDAQTVFNVHQLTYTLENALEKLREEMEDLAEVLEEVHLASERNDGETVKNRGEVYLETARKIVP
ncbi:MAG: hypothetical protein LC667_05935 [Thioalkalivibrio sp.]|nr:hypothetical protein [Thioalkalivibrio sp.]